MSCIRLAVVAQVIVAAIVVGFAAMATGCGSQESAPGARASAPAATVVAVGTIETAIPATAPVAPPPPEATRQPMAPSIPPTSIPAQDAPSGLTGTVWIWQRYVDSGEKGSFAVPYPAAYRLELLLDGKYSLQADCNRGSGSYSVEGSRLVLNPGPITRAECRQGSRSGDFLRMLGQVATFVLKSDTLYLNLKMDSGDMVFGKLFSVTGRIVGSPGDTAPEGGTTEAMVVDSAGRQIGGSIVKAQLPMEFEAPFKPENIDPSTVYTLEVAIKDAQKNVLFRNSSSHPVVTRGNPTYHLEVQVQRTGSGAVAPSGLNIDPRGVALDTQGLPFPSYRVDRVAGSSYDISSPPGPKGLPEHLQVGFGLIDQPGNRAYHPVMYIVPADAYSQLWSRNGNGAVTGAMAKIRELGERVPSPAPIRGMPLLPYELSAGVNDLAVQIRNIDFREDGALGDGFRYVGRFAQDANPVTNNGRLRYIYQGFTRDGKFFVSFSCEVYTSALPDPRAVPAEVSEKLAGDYWGYMRETAAMLNALPSSAWELDLARLDAFISSLRFRQGGTS